MQRTAQSIALRQLPRFSAYSSPRSATHDEASELMHAMCGETGWWDIRNSRNGLKDFPPIPLAWR